jgi:hypothetical protein
MEQRDGRVAVLWVPRMKISVVKVLIVPYATLRVIPYTGHNLASLVRVINFVRIMDNSLYIEVCNTIQ